jgi:hypothetical protein
MAEPGGDVGLALSLAAAGACELLCFGGHELQFSAD